MQHRLDEAGTALTIAPLPDADQRPHRAGADPVQPDGKCPEVLQPGRAGEIRVSGSVARGRAIIEVADKRGIDPRDHERIFDLFRRSGVQDQPGEGIGLAHVRALAYRLGGVIEVVSELGQGATFRVNLPIEWKGAEANG
jgi:light-regulated signal transduction histidine kinase (bacteriophytochrome)